VVNTSTSTRDPAPARAPSRPRPRHAATGSRRLGVAPDSVLIIGIFATLLLLFIGIGRQQIDAYDGQSMQAVTHNLVDHFTLKTTGAFDDYFGYSTPYSPYGIGVSLALVPLFSLSKAFGHQAFWDALLNPILVAATAAVVFAIGRRLGWRRTPAVLAAFAFGALTMALQASTELFSEPGVALCEALAVLAVLQWSRGSRWAPLLLGCALAVAVQFRSDSLITVWIVLLVLPLFVPMRTLLTRRALVLVGAPMALSLAFLCWYDELRSGSLFMTSYEGQSYSAPLLKGLEGFLVSPGKSIFVYNPLAVVGLVGLVVMALRRQRFAALAALLIIPRLLLFSKWSDWSGGWSWGPRFMMPVVFLLVIGAFSLVGDRTLGVLTRRVSAALIALACLAAVPVSFLSIRVPYDQWHVVLTSPHAREQFLGTPVFDGSTGNSGGLPYSEVWTFAASDLHGQYLLWRSGQDGISPVLWREHDDALGWLLVGASGLGSAVLVAVAVRADRRGRRRGDASLPGETVASRPPTAPRHEGV
jgi:hypothetical protein